VDQAHHRALAGYLVADEVAMELDLIALDRLHG
jgi:hypothetical protein